MHTEENWRDFITHAAAGEHFGRLYAEANGLPEPETYDGLFDEIIANMTPEFADYLYWVTISQWGAEAVPADFWAKARERWPKVRLPKFFPS
ncbi:hypothetical protein [Mesorhizobium sp. M8A.F.Ca.ET.021.01.1.1]|uniref:hypothetical protein n=1 Tax=Mesorhizobium sp. M8A.F.Ca.ET.021.01.1.1 TaxID=2496757 RepID=UPI000FCB8863|nr:hypothetical protein [Mesorhizobium sp. M8A.F.Ca.ET.021.01.1.1]RUW56813.1 hypothetical protein EOA36_02110 [Mesorhizobium sp. M8A.F.Ca.ET.021.01.1.1]